MGQITNRRSTQLSHEEPAESDPSSSESGDPPRSGRDWLSAVYDQLRALAAERLRHEAAGHTLQPTALVHEAWLRLAQHADSDFRDEAHFRAVAAQSMRQILIDHARRRNSLKRGGDRLRVTVDDVPTAERGDEIDLLRLDAALGRLQEVDARKGRVVELRYFGGLTIRQIAEVLEVSPKTVEADWYMARAWLRTQLAPET